MATKPATIFTFATDAVFGSGPATGFATKIVPGSLPQGFIPGTGINAEWVNYLFNVTGQWVTDWLDQGTFLKNVDAHILETDAGGETGIPSLDVGGTVGATGFAFTASENGAFSSLTAQIINGTPNGIALDVFGSSSGGVGRAARVVQFGSDLGLEVLSAGPGLDVTASSFYTAITATGGGGGGIGIQASGGGAIGPAHGGVFTGSGANGAGILASADTTSSRAAVEASFFGGGTPLRGAVYLQAQGEPTAAVDGDLWKRPGFAGFGRGGLEWWDNDGAPEGGSAGKQRAWSTTGGLGYQYNQAFGDQSESAGVLTTAVSQGLGFATSPGDPPGDWICEFSGLIRLGGFPTAVSSRAVVEFHNSSGLVARTEWDFASLGQNKSFNYTLRVALLSAATETLSIKFQSLSGGGNEVIISQCKIVCRGAYENNSI
jgi:hypothetical protein